MKKVLLAMVLGAVLLALTGCACKHEETKLIDAVDATCTQQGYTGDTFCVKCEKVVSKGQPIEMLPHAEGAPTGVKEPSCTEDGYTGDIHCTVCGELLKQGEAIPATGHVATELTDVYEATCTMSGYSGDERCTACGAIVALGEEIPPLEHTPGEVVDAYAPTCTSLGYTGDVHCTVCGETLEWGESIPKLEHSLLEPRNAVEATCLSGGYTGDRECSVCHEIVCGENVPRRDHDYVDGACSLCGWREPGLYVDGALALSWEDMESYGYVTVEDGHLLDTSGDFSLGTLVIGEDVTYMDGNHDHCLDNANVRELWIPRSVTELGNYLLYNNDFVTDVVMYCQVTSIPADCFYSSAALERVVLPETVQTIGSDAFAGCPNLREINLPETLVTLGPEAFASCGIRELKLPSHLRVIDLRAFSNSGLTHIELPASVTEMGAMVFEYCRALESVDMSACTGFPPVLEYSMFNYCVSLTSLKLPPNLESFYDSMLGSNVFGGLDDIPLRELAFPDGFKSVGDENFENVNLERVIWPTSLIDAGGLVNCPLQEIYYRGSEAQWNMVSGHDAFAGATIVFNYDPENSAEAAPQ